MAIMIVRDNDGYQTFRWAKPSFTGPVADKPAALDMSDILATDWGIVQ